MGLVTVACQRFRPRSARTGAGGGPREVRSRSPPRRGRGPVKIKPPATEPAGGEAPGPRSQGRRGTGEPPPAESVKITNEMVDRFLQQMPEDDKVNLDGVTPMSWDEDEASGKTNPQNQREGRRKRSIR